MDGWNTTFLLGRPIFRGYVSFREGTPDISMGSMFCLIRLRQIADSISYMTMMNGFEITGDWQQALQLLHHVQQQKLEAD